MQNNSTSSIQSFSPDWFLPAIVNSLVGLYCPCHCLGSSIVLGIPPTHVLFHATPQQHPSSHPQRPAEPRVSQSGLRDLASQHQHHRRGLSLPLGHEGCSAQSCGGRAITSTYVITCVLDNDVLCSSSLLLVLLDPQHESYLVVQRS